MKFKSRSKLSLTKSFFLLFVGCFASLTLLAQKKKAIASNFAAGKAIYAQRCVTCHQVDGGGAQNMIPPLSKTSYVLGDKQSLIKILLNGMSGEIKVNGDMYSNEMPSQAFLKDEEIAAVLTYVRQNFGNKANAVTVVDVKRARAINKQH